MKNFIETWIHEHLDPIENSTAQMRYKGWSTVAGDDLSRMTLLCRRDYKRAMKRANPVYDRFKCSSDSHIRRDGCF